MKVDPRFGRWDAEQGQVLTARGGGRADRADDATTLPPLDEGPSGARGAVRQPAARRAPDAAHHHHESRVVRGAGPRPLPPVAGASAVRGRCRRCRRVPRAGARRHRARGAGGAPVDDTVLHRRRLDAEPRPSCATSWTRSPPTPATWRPGPRNGQPLAVCSREGSTTEYDPALVAELLNERVTFRLAAAEVARRGLVATDADRAGGPGRRRGRPGPGRRRPAPPRRRAAGGRRRRPAAGGRAVLDAFGSYRDVLLAGVVDLQLLQRALGLGTGVSIDEAARLLYDRTRDQIAVQACVPPRAGAGRAGAGRRRAGAGADRGRVRRRPRPGHGAAGPRRRRRGPRRAGRGRVRRPVVARRGAATSAARPGAGTTAPSRTPRGTSRWARSGRRCAARFGYHLVQVYERRERTYDELLPSLRAAVRDQGQEALQAWLREASRRRR